MLLEIDRVQLAVPDAASAVSRWPSILGAEISAKDEIACLGASRTSLRLGSGLIEVLEPDGSGLVADAVASRGAHMFAAGASCADIDQLQKSLNVDNIVNEGGQLFIDGEDIGIKGLRVVVSKHEERSQVGDIDFLYEATLLAQNSGDETARFAEVFSLDAQEFVEIDSPNFGY